MARDGEAMDARFAAPDAGTADDPPASTADAAFSCTEQVGSCPSQSFAQWTALVDASELAAHARLIATGGESVLAEIGDGSFRAVHVPLDGEQSRVPRLTAWDVPAGDQRPTAITDASDTSGKRLFVLACSEERTSCNLLHATIGADLVANWETNELPAGFLARGLVIDDAHLDEPGTVCVYGSGLLCFEGGWREAIAPSAGLRINDVAIGWNWSVAVGDEGRWFKRDYAADALGTWKEQASLGPVALTQASVAGAGGVIVGDGRIQAPLGEQRALFGCEAPRELIALMLQNGAPGLGYAVTSSGEVLRHMTPGLFQKEPYCAHDALPGGAVLDVATLPCGVSLNPRVLTANVLFGVNACAVE
jgi:hypothetical protein